MRITIRFDENELDMVKAGLVLYAKDNPDSLRKATALLKKIHKVRKARY